MRQVNLRLPENLLDGVERTRGGVPRERWIRDAVETRLALEGNVGGVEDMSVRNPITRPTPAPSSRSPKPPAEIPLPKIARRRWA